MHCVLVYYVCKHRYSYVLWLPVDSPAWKWFIFHMELINKLHQQSMYAQNKNKNEKKETT